MELCLVLECKLSEIIIIMQHSSTAIWNSQVGSINPFKAKTFASLVQQLHLHGFGKSWTTDTLSINILTPTLKWNRPEPLPPRGRWSRKHRSNFQIDLRTIQLNYQMNKIPLGTWSSKSSQMVNPVGITQVVGPQAMAAAYFEHFVFSFFHTRCDLTQATQLADDGGERVVSYTFQLIANPIRYWSVAEMPWLNVPLD